MPIDLGAIIARVLPEQVLPQLDALLRPGELESLRVSVEEGRAILELVVVGEPMWFWLFDTDVAEISADLGARFRSDLQDFIAESRFGWGELRGESQAD